MKYRMNFGGLKTGVLVFMALVCVTIFLLDVCMLAGVMEIDPSSIPVVGVSLAAIIIVLVAVLMLLFNSFYRFDEKCFLIVLGFFCDKLYYDYIEQIKFNTKSNEVTLIYNTMRDQDGIQTIKLNLNDVQSNKILDDFRVHCPEVIVESYTPKPKDKDKDKK